MNLEDIYINELMKETEFKRLIELKKIIDKKYGMKIVAFKNKEALYLEAYIYFLLLLNIRLPYF